MKFKWASDFRGARQAGRDARAAVIALVGASQSFHTVNHRAIAGYPRCPREGYLYA